MLEEEDVGGCSMNFQPFRDMIDDQGLESDVEGLVRDEGRAIVSVDSEGEVRCAQKEQIFVLGKSDPLASKCFIYCLEEGVSGTILFKYSDSAIRIGGGQHSFIFGNVGKQRVRWVADFADCRVGAIECLLQDQEFDVPSHIDSGCVLRHADVVRKNTQLDRLIESEADSRVQVDFDCF